MHKIEVHTAWLPLHVVTAQIWTLTMTWHKLWCDFLKVGCMLNFQRFYYAGIELLLQHAGIQPPKAPLNRALFHFAKAKNFYGKRAEEELRCDINATKTWPQFFCKPIRQLGTCEPRARCHTTLSGRWISRHGLPSLTPFAMSDFTLGGNVNSTRHVYICTKKWTGMANGLMRKGRVRRARLCRNCFLFPDHRKLREKKTILLF